MIVTILKILAKVKELPDDYAEHVHPSEGNTAEVTSFSKLTQEEPYIVQIELTDEKTEGLRDVRCSCEVTELCDHVTAFYAVAKGIKPKASEEKPKVDKPKKPKAKKTTSKKVKGKKDSSKQRVELYDEISASFAKLAILEDQSE